MKRIKILVLAAFVGLLHSCDDAVDIVQEGELYPETAFETLGDLQSGLYAVYAIMPGETEIYFTSIFTDEAARGLINNGVAAGGDMNFILTPNSGYASSIWESYYRLINVSTRLIEAAPDVDYTEEEAAEYNNIVAQAYAIRAYAHLKLMSYFAEDMKNDASLGVIALNRIPSITEKLPRNTSGEVFELINSDLDFAAANMTEQPINNRFYVGPNFVTAVRARMAAYRGQYELAEGFADDLISKYTLTAKAYYPAIWDDTEPTSASRSEVIFKIDRNSTSTGNFSQYWSAANSTVSGTPYLEVGRALFNLVNNPADVRRFVIADETSVIDPDYANSDDYLNSDVLPVGKYPGSAGIALLNDIKVFRVSEMYFIKAEARANAGDINGAATAIQAVRRARINSSQVVTYSTTTEAWAGILQERRIELAFEGHRYIDIKRLGALAGGAGVDRDPQDCAYNNACTLAPTDYRFTFPIPFSELRVNPVIAQQQNDGY